MVDQILANVWPQAMREGILLIVPTHLSRVKAAALAHHPAHHCTGPDRRPSVRPHPPWYRHSATAAASAPGAPSSHRGRPGAGRRRKPTGSATLPPVDFWPSSSYHRPRYQRIWAHDNIRMAWVSVRLGYASISLITNLLFWNLIAMEW